MADLNIGISQAIWSVNPFLISILERVVYGTAFDRRQFFGMSALIFCAIFVSLSEVIEAPADEDAGEEVDPEKADKVPVWAAVLCSVCNPCVCTLFVLVIKHANETLKIAAKDFTIAYWGVMSLIF